MDSDRQMVNVQLNRNFPGRRILEEFIGEDLSIRESWTFGCVGKVAVIMTTPHEHLNIHAQQNLPEALKKDKFSGKTREGITLPGRCSRDQLKKGRHDNTDTEVGVLMDITGHGSFLREGGTFRHRNRVTRTHIITMPTREAETRLFIQTLLTHVLVVSPSGAVFLGNLKSVPSHPALASGDIELESMQ
ncbi:hypothetical protein AVEN_213323-1 [Araneus ventricosus]|uniref:Uncharacterized protein n=1 Tax=Araneus ventricosus TaxID=182803 RepID=A0A4Y2LNC2_ARAVE|nr:hypothetical protein AVEN_213323-1 [Araneus ventricosus]